MLYILRYLILLSTLIWINPCHSATRLNDEGSNQGYINILDCVGSEIACTRSGIIGTITVSGISGGTSLPGSPVSGNLFIVTDDSAVGECDSNAGSAITLCRYNGSVWEPVSHNTGASGDVTSAGDCADGACYDGTSDGGTYMRLYDGDSHYGAIVVNNISANRTYTFGDLDLTFNQSVASGAAPTFTADNFSDGGSNAIITTTQETNFGTAYTHSQDNTQAHSDYLLNNASDSMAGVLTNQGVNPDGDNTRDLGATTTARWRDLYLAGSLKDDTNAVTVANLKTAYDHSQDNTQAHTDYALHAGDTYTGTHDFSGAVFEIPNGTTDQALTVGQVFLNATDDQLSTHGGATGEVQDEAALSLLFKVDVPIDVSGYYDLETTYRVYPLFEVDDTMPEGFTLTEWSVDYVGGDPTTELDADLMCDTTPDFNPAAGATVMDVIDTTAGASSADTGFDSSTCANAAQVYIRFGADPTDANVVVKFRMNGYRNED